MKIETIYVFCYRYDVRLARTCVASIRNWYPTIPIFLVKDRHYGDFETRDIERCWQVKVYHTSVESLGWGFGKLDIIIQTKKQRCLLLDADTVMAGPVLDRLNPIDEHFVVAKEDYDNV